MGANGRQPDGRPRSWAVWVLLLLGAVGLGLAVVDMAAVRAAGGTPLGDHVTVVDVVDLLLAGSLLVLGALVVLRGEVTRYGWLLLATGVATAAVEGAGEHAARGWWVAPPGTLPGADVAVWAQDLWFLAWVPLVLLLPSLFPDGRAIGRWGRPLWVLTTLWTLLFAFFVVAERPATNVFLDVPEGPANPTGWLSWGPAMDVVNTGWVLLSAASVVVAVGSLVTRWRRADHEGRQQLKWVLLALGLAALAIVVELGTTVAREAFGIGTDLTGVLGPVTWWLVVVSLGVGVLRFRLYDVDAVINRTLVYVTMTGVIVAAYVVVVHGVAPRLTGAGGTEASLLATALVAVAFAPVRDAVQRGVNRWLFGRRGDPYAMLGELGERLTGSSRPDATLAAATETVTAALKLPGMAIDVELDGEWDRRAATGDLSGTCEEFPLRHAGEVVGRLVVARRSPNEVLHADDVRLLGDVASRVAALAQAVRLDLDLQRSREGLVLAREEERRRLRRDLHDGLGPSLASQTFRLDAALALLHEDPDAAADVLRSLKQQNRDLVADIRQLVHELRPPALDELGLASALAAHAGQLANALEIDITTVPSPLEDLPAAVEVAAYHIAREAITNVVRHAGARSCRVALRLTDEGLAVHVEDDGVGVREVTQPGVGLASMRERVEELGGSLEVSRLQPRGTSVLATLPIAGRRAAAMGQRALVERARPDHEPSTAAPLESHRA